MDENEIKHVVESALLAAGRPLTLDKLGELFSARGSAVERATLKQALTALNDDYKGRGIEVGEVASGFRVQVKRSMSDWLTPLWEERAPRYTRALLETLALIAYRQPITRGEIEQVRGVAVSANIIRTLLERSWIRVVGHRDVPGKPEMFGTTREFLDYFGLKKLEDLPPLAELKDGLTDFGRQADLIESLEIERATVIALESAASAQGETAGSGASTDAAGDARAAEGTEAGVQAADEMPPHDSADAHVETPATEGAEEGEAPRQPSPLFADSQQTSLSADPSEQPPEVHTEPTEAVPETRAAASEPPPDPQPSDDAERERLAEVITLKRSESS